MEKHRSPDGRRSRGFVLTHTFVCVCRWFEVIAQLLLSRCLENEGFGVPDEVYVSDVRASGRGRGQHLAEPETRSPQSGSELLITRRHDFLLSDY